MKQKGNKKMPIPRHEIIDTHPYIIVFNKITCTQLHVLLFSNCTPSTHKQQNNCIAHEQRCRDGVINDLLSRYRHLLVPLLFHDVTSLNPSFQRNDFSTCIRTYGTLGAQRL